MDCDVHCLVSDRSAAGAGIAPVLRAVVSGSLGICGKRQGRLFDCLIFLGKLRIDGEWRGE